ncbi:putative fungal-specific transcription factor [Aspergillus varians]
MMSHITSVSTTSQRHQPDSLQALQTSGTTASSRPASKTPSSRRRDKPQLSCNQCRRRKSRCDRQRPCSCCSARDQICTYPENSVTTGPPGLSSGASSVHDRIVQLERLVVSMMPSPAGRSNAEPAPEVSLYSRPAAAIPVNTVSIETPIDVRSECGSMRIHNSELAYVGEDHWVAILDGIADLKDHLDHEEQMRLAKGPDDNGDEQRYGNAASGGAFMLYGCRRPASRDEVLMALPPKCAVDRYISRYFNYVDLVSSSAVHGPSFLREYDAFWADPSSVPIIWVGLLFSMICLACLASDPLESSEAEQQSLQIDLYREKIVQCLVMGQYTKSGPYVLETVINYIYVEFGINPDANKDMWFLLALEVNLARRMGYHRDPSHFPGISPFQGEMRRRLWATVLMSDILISNQMGMPRMISDWKYDTSEPRNLNDDDFDKDTAKLPPSRPETELTAALGIIARTRMLKALGLVADLTSAVKPCHYTEVMRVDGILHEAAESIPSPLKMKPLAASLTDTPQVIVARLFIQHMLYKGQVMLHRRFIYMQVPSQNEDIYGYSRKACLDASLGTLEIQHVFDEETRPGGQLQTMRWRVTSIMNHQFLTATMLLCSLLYRGQDIEREDEIRAALQRARITWIRRSAISKEAKRAAEAVSLVLSGAGEGRGGGNKTNITTDAEDPRLRGIEAPQDVDGGVYFDGLNLLADTTRLHEADQLAMPDFLGTFIPSDLQDKGLSFDVTCDPSPLDEWTTFVNWPKPR